MQIDPNVNFGKQSDRLSFFLFPKSRTAELGLGQNQSFEGYNGVAVGPQTTQVGAYTSVFAPSDLLSSPVLTDARNRVSF